MAGVEEINNAPCLDGFQAPELLRAAMWSILFGSSSLNLIVLSGDFLRGFLL